MKKTVCLFICFALIFCLYAESFAYASDVITITTAKQFMEISKNTKGDYVLANDIDFEGITLTDCIADAFSGSLDGNGFTVKNLTFVSDKSRVAVFDTVTGSISNVVFAGQITQNVKSVDSACASVCVTLNKGKLKRVANYIDITVTSPDASVGGICANSKGASVIENCVNEGNITFSNSKNGAVSYMGGIVSSVTGAGATVSYCENKGTLSSGNELSGNINVGGICAFVNGQSTVSYCLNDAKVSANGRFAFSGGICAIISNYAIVKASENTGSIISTGTESAEAGGVVASVSGSISGGSVHNCANYGKVLSNKGVQGGIVAQFNGRNLMMTYSKQNTYALLEGANKTENNYVCVSKEYNGFDFDKIWTLENGLPHIKNVGAELCPQNTDIQKLEWSFENGVLTVWGRGDMPDYSKKSAPWYYLWQDIKSIVIKDGLTSVGEWAFGYCMFATKIDIADTVTSIGTLAFYKCMSLQELFIPQNVTFIGAGVASYCNSIVNVSLPSCLKKIPKYSFLDCNSIQNVYYSGTDEMWQNMNILLGNDPIINAKIKTGATGGTNWSFDSDTGVLTVSGNGILYGTSAKQAPWQAISSDVLHIVVSEGVCKIGSYAFGYCFNAKTVTLPQSLTVIDSNAFYRCMSVKEVTLPQKLQTLGAGAFYNCKALCEITLGATVSSIGKYTFEGCSALKTVNFTGSAEQFSKLDVADTGNDSFKNANVINLT